MHKIHVFDEAFVSLSDNFRDISKNVFLYSMAIIVRETNYFIKSCSLTIQTAILGGLHG